MNITGWMARCVAALAAGCAVAAQADPRPGANAVPLRMTITEEGQKVIFDGETWRNRELAKRLPLEEAWPADKDLPAAFVRFGLNKSDMPDALPTPSRIVDDVYLVNSVPNNTYLIDAGAEGLILIDPGLSKNYGSIVVAIERLGFSAKKIRWVINTHAHFDHSQADELFRRAGAKILIGAADADAVERQTRVVADWVFPQEAGAGTPSKVDWRVVDGERLRLGNKTLLAISTPGHTAGSTCFYLKIGGKNVLFSGDTLLFDHRLALQVPSYSSNLEYSSSLTKLTTVPLSLSDSIRWDMLLAGHGAIVLDRAYMDVEKGRETVQLDLLNGDPIDWLPYKTSTYRMMMYGRP